jgi:AAA15 family ATPase/GTPase
MEIVRLTDGKEILVDHQGGRVYHISVQATHEQEPGKEVQLELTEESDGTRRLLNLIPALHPTAFTGVVHVIDEIDRSLHPILVREFLEFFLKSSKGDFRQVIVTTHESNLLDQDLLRRDEIWFAEKDSTGATRLYSLLDFKVRNDLEIRKHYLQGRFGAIPFLGNLESLLATPDRHE